MTFQARGLRRREFPLEIPLEVTRSLRKKLLDSRGVIEKRTSLAGMRAPLPSCTPTGDSTGILASSKRHSVHALLKNFEVR